MGKTIEELFKTKVLSDGKTAEQKYDIRNSKDLPISANTTVLLQPSFNAATAIRRKISTTKGESRLEQETTGLRILNKLSAPLIYGTDIFKFQKKSTRLVEIMKDGVNSNNPQDAGIVGNFLKKAEDFGLRVAGKLGIAFPESTIPTKISLNADFKAGKEPDTMITLAKIKGDSKGNLIGQVLKNSARGTPKQIGNQLLGAGINLLKGEIKKKLFGAPKQGAQNLAKKGENEVQYDSSAKYSDTVNPTDEDVYKRNDLSSIQFERLTGKKQAQANAINKFLEDSKSKINLKSLPAPTPNLGGKLNLDTSRFNIGGKISSIKDSVTSKLSSARKEGQTLIANSKLKIGDINPAVPAEQPAPPINYSSTIDAKSDDIKLRNDLSSKLDALNGANDEAKSNGATVTPPGAPEAPVDASALSNKLLVKSPFATTKETLDSTTKDATAKLSEGRKEGQQNLAAKDERAIAAGIESKHDGTTKYSDTVDETQDDVKLRNDLSSKLDALNAALATLDTSGTSAERPGVTISTYSSLKDGQTPKVTLKTKYGIDSRDKLDIVNEKTQYDGSELKIGPDTLDDYDFITLKFTSIAKKQSVNFRATLSGITETTTPSWDSAKFIGSPFPYWTYTGIERSVSFNFKVYSTTPLQHIAAWQRLNFLTSLAYPQGYNKGIAVLAPFLKITIGNLYKNKECYISSLSYTVDDTGTWEVGPTAGMGIADNQSFKLNGETTSLDNYKLPKIIDVSVTLNLVESKSSTKDGYLYGFDKLPRVAGKTSENTAKPLENTSTQSEAATDANSKTSTEQSTPILNTTATKADTVSATAAVNNPGQATTPTKTGAGMENAAPPKVDPPPTYRIEVKTDPATDGYIGNVYANGKLIYNSNGLPYMPGYFTYGEDGKKYTEKAGVTEFLRYKSKISGWTGNDGKDYPASTNITIS
jgi:hypothetical protein